MWMQYIIFVKFHTLYLFEYTKNINRRKKTLIKVSMGSVRV